MAENAKRIELIEPAPDDDHRSRRIGLGLLGSLVLGFRPLSDALSGSGPFEHAVGRFLICIAVSIGAALTLGRLIDGAPPPPETDEDEATGGPASSL